MDGIVVRETAAFTEHPRAEHGLRKVHLNLLAKVGPQAQLVDDFRIALTAPSVSRWISMAAIFSPTRLLRPTGSSTRWIPTTWRSR